MRCEGDEPLVHGSPSCALFDDGLTSCIGGDRFAVTAIWQDFTDRSGFANPVPFASGDSAVFWFFDPENWELTVKVLDGCEQNGHYWVFVSGLTNVAYSVAVEDTRTGEVRLYDNPLGQRSPAVVASRAFSCEGS